MTIKAESNYEPTSKIKQVIVIRGAFISFLGGTFAAIVGIDNFKNYNSPNLFAFLFGTLGLITGLMVARKIKPFVILNPVMLAKYTELTILFSIGFIGTFMLAGQSLNSAISHLYKCDDYVIVNKEFHKGFRLPEKYILIVNIEGENQRLLCRHHYWQTIAVGQTAKICIYESPIGFDFLNLSSNE